MLVTENICVRFTHDFIRRVVSELDCLGSTATNEPATNIFEVDGIGQVIHQRLQQVTFVSRRCFGAFAWSCVPEDRFDAHDLFVFVTQRRFANFDECLSLNRI